MTKRMASVLVLCGVLGASLSLSAAKTSLPGELDEDHSLSTRLVTPHTPWGKGWAKGRVSALFVVGTGEAGTTYGEPGTRLRAVVELLQRFDLDADAIFVTTTGEFYKGKEGRDRARRLLQKEYDVYVFGNVQMEAFFPEFQYRILDRVVNKGAGLLCCGQPPRKIMTPKRRLADIPAFLSDAVPLSRLATLGGVKGAAAGAPDAQVAAKLITGYRLGKGRAVSLNYGAFVLAPYLNFRYRALTEYDYWLLLVGRAVLWCGNRDGDVSLAAASLSAPRDELAGTPVRCTLGNPRAKAVKLRIALDLCRGDGTRTPLPEATVTVPAGGTADLPVALPRLRADDYFLDVTARSSNGVEACGAVSVTVTAASGIQSVVTDVPFVERGGKIGVTVTPRGPPGTGAHSLNVQLRDGFGRVLARQEQALQAGAATATTFSFEVGDWATIQMRAEAVLLQNGEEIEMKEASFLVPKRRRGQFNFVQWAARNDVLEYYAWNRLAEAGWKVTLGGVTDVLAAGDVSIIPYSTRLVEEFDADGVMKPFCWNDETKVNEHVAKIVEKVAACRPHGTFVYSLGDEGTTKGCCVHPACLAVYREYLRRQYATVERLNASWSSTYKSFDEVDVLDPKDGMENKAPGQGLFARWYDRQAFSRYNLCRFAHRFVEAFRTLDPQAITGFEGTGGFGDDYDAILDSITFWSPYPSIGDDILRGVAPRRHIRANWMGYHKQADPLINYSWRMVMKEMDSIWWWRYDGIGAWRGYISPALDFWPATQTLCDEMRVVREGLGDLLLHGQVKHSGIAVFYSLPSALAGQLGDNRTFPAPEAAFGNWLRCIYDLGLDLRCITSNMLQSGVLDSGEFKLLLLPMVQAIGPDEAAAIRRFAENGGTVLADLRPGVMDDHCKPTAPGALDDLFGVRRTGPGQAEKQPLALQVTLGTKALALNAPETRTDPQVAATGAKAMAQAGKTPVVLMNTAGKGRTVLLNFDLPGPGGKGGLTDETCEFVRALFALAAVQAPLVASRPDGGALHGTETRCWQTGEMLVVGLWNEMNVKFFNDDAKAELAGMPARIALPEKRVVYDLRAGKGGDATARIDTKLLEGRTNFFAVLPYRIAGVKITTPAATPKAGEMLRADVALEIPADAKATHAAYVRVLDPTGKEVAWGGQVVMLPNGKGSVSIPVAWNDAPGRWRLQATELFSRKTAELAWVVK